MKATPDQLAALRAVLRHGGIKPAAASLGLSERQVYRRMESLRHANRCTSWGLVYLLGQEDGPDQQTLWSLDLAA